MTEIKGFSVFRRLLVAGCHRLPHPEWEASVPRRSPGPKLLRGLRRHLPLPGQKQVSILILWPLILSKIKFTEPDIKNSITLWMCDINFRYFCQTEIILLVFCLFLLLSSGVMETGSMSSLTTASQPSTTSWSSRSRLRGTSSGAPCWRRPTPSESCTVWSWSGGQTSVCRGSFSLARINMVPTQNSRNYPLFAPAAFIHLQVWDNFLVFLKKGHKDKQMKMAGAEQEEFLQFLTKHFYESEHNDI